MSEKEESKKKVLKSRVYELVTLLNHPDTGEEIITIEDIEGVLNTYSSIKDYAYIVHDKDTYTEEDIKKDGVDKSKLGTLKPKHIHVVMRSIRAQNLETVAKWFGFEDKPNFIKKWSGKGAFTDAMLYLTHASEKQQKLGKHRYSEEEVTCSLQSGETYSEFIQHIEERIEKFGKKDVPLHEELELEVLYYGMKLREIRAKYKDEYNRNMEKLKKNRLDHLKNQPMPPFRFNVYVTGDGGSGKGLISEALACTLIDPDGKMKDEDIFFTVGAQSVSFEGYDGQPVIIWDDCRSNELFQKLDSRGNIFNVFDPHPKNISQNIKYGSIKLTNSINIINSVQPFEEFCNKIAGEHIDRKSGVIIPAEESQICQIYRRFPLVIEIIDAEHFNLNYNMAFFNEAKDYKTLCYYGSIYAPFKKMISRVGTKTSKYKDFSKKSLDYVKKLHEDALKIHSTNNDNTDDLIDIDFDKLGLPDITEPMPFDDIIEIT